MNREDTENIVHQLAKDAGGKITEIGQLSPNDGFAIMELPLPTNHWLTQETEHCEAPPMPFRIGVGPARAKLEEAVMKAARYAVRASTMNGKYDFDPDALVRNFITGLFGYYTETGLSSDEWANPVESGSVRVISALIGNERFSEMEQRKDAAYLERNQVVAALSKLFPAGVAKTAIEGWSEDWHGCVYIDLPTGQVSWHFHDSQAHLFAHLPLYEKPWDGHTTEEKYTRLTAL